MTCPYARALAAEVRTDAACQGRDSYEQWEDARADYMRSYRESWASHGATPVEVEPLELRDALLVPQWRT